MMPTWALGAEARLRGARSRGAGGRGGSPGWPAPALLEHLWQIPVVENHHGLDPLGEQGIHQPVVEAQACLIDRAAALRRDPGPGHGQAVGADSQLRPEGHVLFPAVVVVAGHVAGVPVAYVPGGVSEAVPDALASPIRATGPPDVVG